MSANTGVKFLSFVVPPGPKTTWSISGSMRRIGCARTSTASASSSPAIPASAALARTSPPSFAICQSATIWSCIVLYRQGSTSSVSSTAPDGWTDCCDTAGGEERPDIGMQRPGLSPVSLSPNSCDHDIQRPSALGPLEARHRSGNKAPYLVSLRHRARHAPPAAAHRGAGGCGSRRCSSARVGGRALRSRLDVSLD